MPLDSLRIPAEPFAVAKIISKKVLNGKMAGVGKKKGGEAKAAETRKGYATGDALRRGRSAVPRFPAQIKASYPQDGGVAPAKREKSHRAKEVLSKKGERRGKR